MAGYGRLKRKNNTKRNDLCLSPTKFSSGSDTPSLVSSVSSCSYSSSDIFSSSREDLSSSLGHAFDDIFSQVHVEVSSPIIKSSKLLEFESVFKEFEDLENEVLPTTNKFNKFKNINLLKKNEGDEEFEPIDLDLNSSISSSLMNLNTRILELQSKINSEGLEEKVETKKVVVIERKLTTQKALRHYGDTRTHKIKEKSLSDEEDSDEDSDEDILPLNKKTKRVDDQFDLTSCQSSNDLRFASELARKNVGFDMLIEEI